MRILLDLSINKYGLTPNEIFFLSKCFQLLTKEHPEHEWIFDPFQKTKGAISLLPLGIKKTLLLERLQPQVLITTGEVLKKSTGNFKQIYFYNQENEKNKKDNSALRHPSLIVTTSTTLKKKITASHAGKEMQITVIPAAPPDEIREADWSEKLSVKEKYADGREFFFCFKEIGPASNWEEVLKAFSIFKKWQQSSFKLVIAGKIESGFKEQFAEKLGSYKYQADVRLLDQEVDDVDGILSTAFGCICADPDHTGICLLSCFKAGVPAISSAVELFDEEVSGAFLPALPAADELSRQLINLYRDEQLREMLVEKGKEMHLRYSWKKSTEKWMESILG